MLAVMDISWFSVSLSAIAFGCHISHFGLTRCCVLHEDGMVSVGMLDLVCMVCEIMIS